MSDDDQDRTIYVPAPGIAPEPQAPPPQPAPAPASQPASGGDGARSIKVGDVLNHLYEVRRPIARGGMGEVFEGSNVNYSEERVAIKVILPHLAADPAVQSMFFKEARTLTRLSHPALVQYRTMAQEPQLGVFYIVTEYVDGPNLSDKLGSLAPDAKQIASLMRRLAEGLALAHSLGAIHRDISPDNILLEGGAVERAKIIDFGIAKDLDPTAATIVGDGFAGKLNYVAPEQLGDYGREIGPWSDVYSLGLTILAVARGRDVDMGGTIVDAVDKRRSGPDLSPVPEGLRPLLQRMLVANPAERIRSMDEVVQWLADWSRGVAPGGLAGGGQTPGKAAKDRQPGQWQEKLAAFTSRIKLPPALSGPRGMMIAGGGALGLLVLVAVVLSMSGGSSSDAGPDPKATTASVKPRVADPLAIARAVLGTGLAKVPCSWLEAESIDGGNGAPVTVSLKGVSGQSAAAIAQVEGLLKNAGVGNVSVSYSDIAPVPASFCEALGAIGQFKASGISHLSVPQVKFEMSPLDGTWGDHAGKPAALAIINVDLSSTSGDVAIVGLAETGQMKVISRGLKDLPSPILESQGSMKYRLNLPSTLKGWSGILLLQGKGPFPDDLLSQSSGKDWSQKFAAAAQSQGWKTDMIWYQSVDEQPDAAPSR